jgi:hypothetical protein
MGVATVGASSQPEPAQPVPPKRSAHILWAVLIARIYEVLPLLCPLYGGQMRVIVFITYSADIRHILEHIGTATANCASRRAATVGRVRCADGRWCRG